MEAARKRVKVWHVALALIVGVVLAPRAAHAVATYMVNVQGSGFTTTQFAPVTIGGGQTTTLPMKPTNGGHVTVFVMATQPGSVEVLECAPINGVTQCAVDLSGSTFAGDNQMHQAADDY